MTLTINHMGVLNSAKISVGNLTILCGKNNTGKSYLTYSLYGILSFLRSDLFYLFDKDASNNLLSRGVCSVDLKKIAQFFWEELSDSNKKSLKKSAPGWFGRKDELAEDTTLDFCCSEADAKEISRRLSSFSCDFPIKVGDEYTLRFTKDKGTTTIVCTYMQGQTASTLYQGVDMKVPESAVRNAQWIVAFLVKERLPRPFIIGSERTGVSVFRDEFSLYRDLAYDDINVSERVRELRERFSFSSYPIATRRDLDFVLQLSKIVRQRKSFLTTRKNGLILEAFEDIVGGKYDVDQDTGELSFVPKGQKEKLSLHESSSSVRALCELYFYLAYCAKKGDVLVIDEPEMNLHPSAQRRLARLLAMLTNMDIRVFITTHSDYILREVNALIRVSTLQAKDKDRILDKHSIKEDALIESKDVSIYVINSGEAEGMVPDAQYGFAVKSFDDTIEKFNVLYTDVCEAEEASNAWNPAD